MATAFSKLQRASWNGIEFPVRRLSVRGALRYHVHEYPHAAGGAFENLERKLYEVRMTCPFLQRFSKYPDLWPIRLATLRTQFETGEAGKLTIPTIGTITARCVAWPEEMDAKVQSGVMVEFEFIEDQSQLNLVETLIQAASANVESAAEAYTINLDDYKTTTGNQIDLLDAISLVANDVFALKDQAELESLILSAKVDRLAAILQEADRTVVDLQNPKHYPLLNSMRDLWAANQQLFRDLQGRRSPLETLVVPMTMSIADISTRIYGDTSRAVELMQLNPLEDALAVPAGTSIKYYLPDAA